LLLAWWYGSRRGTLLHRRQRAVNKRRPIPAHRSLPHTAALATLRRRRRDFRAIGPEAGSPMVRFRAASRPRNFRSRSCGAARLDL